MPRKPRLWCADCGAAMHQVKGSLPQGQARCHSCRRAATRVPSERTYRPDPPCQECGQPLAYKSKGTGRCKACCASRPRMAASRSVGPVECACDVCGVAFLADRGAGNRARYCSVSCRNRRPRGTEVLTCEGCGEPFRWRYTGQRTCGRWCGMLLRNGRWPQTDLSWCDCGLASPSKGARRCDCSKRQERTTWPSSRVFITDCSVCSVTFCTPYTVMTCSKVCAEVKRIEDRRVSKDRRRARKRDAYVADVVRADIYARDKYRCKLCGKKLRMTSVVPHPLAPVLDHIIPLACGGTHEPANVQAAHFLCNSQKAHHGGGEQLLLIG